MNLAEKLIYLRKKQGLTQLQVAEKLDVSRQAVSRWEVGIAVPSTDNLKNLGNLYNIRVDYLLNDDSEHITEKSEECNELTFEKQKKTGIGREHKIVYVVLTIIVAILLIATLVGHIPKQNNKRIVPIGDTIDFGKNTGNDYSTIILPIN